MPSGKGGDLCPIFKAFLLMIGRIDRVTSRSDSTKELIRIFTHAMSSGAAEEVEGRIHLKVCSGTLL